jgi:hypothetical protein
MILQELSGDLPAIGSYYFAGAAAAVALEQALFVAPFRCQIQAVQLVSAATVTGQATNFFTLNIRNRTAAGAGTAVPASLAFSTAPIVATAQIPLTITASATASDLVLAAGDVVTAEKAVTGTGLLMPGGIIVVRLRAY